jgi:glycosyltransferase involved in cell wall biosynthesis
MTAPTAAAGSPPLAEEWPFDLSILVAAYGARETIADSIAALRDQHTAARYEIVLIESSGDGAAEIAAEVIAARGTEVVAPLRVVRCHERRYAGHARNLGVAEARGRLLACTDADCVAAPDWVERVVRAHEQGPPVIGGAVEVANPESFAGWGYYFAEFHRWRPGGGARPIDEVPGCCWSFTREAFARWGPFLEGTYSSDTAFQWRMARDGERPRFDPSIRVAHRNPDALGRSLRHGVLHGRQFARVRAAQQSLRRPRLALNAASAPLLPALLFARTVLGVARNRTYAGRFTLTWPVTLAQLSAWSCGELLGYVAALADPGSASRSRSTP